MDEEWIRFFKSRLVEISQSELEHYNAKIISFSWPKEVLATINDTTSELTGSLNTIPLFRSEVSELLFAYTQNEKMRRRQMASVELKRQKTRDSSNDAALDTLLYGKYNSMVEGVGAN